MSVTTAVVRLSAGRAGILEALRGPRGILRNFGLKVGTVGKVKFEARVEELVESLPDLAGLVERLLIVRRYFASSCSSCIAVCWPSSGTMRCAGA